MKQWWADNRALTIVLGLSALAILAAVLLAPESKRTARHDPDNPGGAGGRAVARVLADQGVNVTVVRSAEDLADTPVDADTTVLVTSAGNLGPSTADSLLEHAAAGRVIIAGDNPGAVRLLGVDATNSILPADDVAADCSDEGIAPLSDLSISLDAANAYATSSGCFGADGGYLIASAGPGLVVLGATDILENDQVLRADNAAVALRLLGRDAHLVWYVPSLADLPPSDSGVTLRSLLPRWVEPALLLLAMTVLALMLWRGRRLGALASEPLPVTVRALETTQARGRLYRSAGDPAHAARALRASTRDRLRRHLGLSVADTDELSSSVAAHIDRPVPQVESLLGDSAPAPQTHDELTRLAAELARLEQEVRQR